MFQEKKHEKTGIEIAIDEVLENMRGLSAETEEYAAMVDQLVKLHKMKIEDRPSRMSKDTLAIVTGNIVGIMLIVGYERANVVTSKAVAFVQKLK